MNPCENIQGRLTDFFQTCSAAELREPTPFFDFLNSEVNNNGLEQVISPGNGKVRTINLKYQKRFLESTVSTNQPNPKCTATDKPEDCIQAYEMDPGRNWQKGMLFSINDFRTICEDNQELFARNVMRLVNAVMRKMATDITNDAAALIGRWNTNVGNVVGADTLEVATLKSIASGDISPITWELIDLAAMQTGYCQQKFIFSGTDLYSYYRRGAFAGCCADEGLNVGDMFNRFGTTVMYDKRVASAAGANTFAWMVQPGALALLTYNQFAGNGAFDVVTQGATYEHRVIQDPQTGFPLDLTIKDDCGQISVNVTATAKVVGLPNDLYAVGDEQFGVKYFNRIKVVNA